MRIDGISLPDVPVMSAALSDDLVLVVRRSGLRVQSYNNLTEFRMFDFPARLTGMSMYWPFERIICV